MPPGRIGLAELLGSVVRASCEMLQASSNRVMVRETYLVPAARRVSSSIPANTTSCWGSLLERLACRRGAYAIELPRAIDLVPRIAYARRSEILPCHTGRFDAEAPRTARSAHHAAEAARSHMQASSRAKKRAVARSTCSDGSWKTPAGVISRLRHALNRFVCRPIVRIQPYFSSTRAIDVAVELLLQSVIERKSRSLPLEGRGAKGLHPRGRWQDVPEGIA